MLRKIYPSPFFSCRAARWPPQPLPARRQNLCLLRMLLPARLRGARVGSRQIAQRSLLPVCINTRVGSQPGFLTGIKVLKNFTLGFARLCFSALCKLIGNQKK